VSKGSALSQAAWLGEGNANVVVGFHAPAIGRMCFANVNRQKLNLIAIALVQRLEGPKLGPERSSGKAAEDEDDWLLAAEIGEPNGPFAVFGF
jgi:hypothetical protein